MSVPVHDLQVYVDIDSYDGAWSDHGDDRWGPELRAKGGGDYSTLFMQRATVHGLGLSVVAYKRVGEDLREIWNNDLLQAGNIDHWLPDLGDRWSRGSIIVQIPDEHNPDFIDSAWVYKTTSNEGKLLIDGIGLHDHYSRTYRTIVKDKVYTGFEQQTAYGIVGGRDFVGLNMRFVDSHTRPDKRYRRYQCPIIYCKRIVVSV